MTSVSQAQSTSLRWAGFAAVVVMACTTAILGLETVRLVSELPESAAGSDFRPFVAAGDVVKAGGSAEVYDIEAQFRAQSDRFEAIDSQEEFLVFANPPFVLPLLALAAPLSTTAAFIALLTATTFALGVCVWLMGRLVGVGEHKSLVGLGILLSSPAVYVALVQTQFSGLLLAGILGAWWADENDRPWAAGAWLALLAIKPHLLLLPIVVLVSGRRWRMLGGLVAAGGFLGVVGTAMVGFSGWFDWLTLGSEVASAGSNWGIIPRGMYTVRSFLHFIGQTDDFSQVRSIWLGWVAVSVGAAVVLGRRTSGLRTRREWGWGTLSVLMLLASPHTNVQDLLIGLVAVVALMRLVSSRPQAVPIATMAVSALWILPASVFVRVVAPPVVAMIALPVALCGLWILDKAALSAPSAELGRSRALVTR